MANRTPWASAVLSLALLSGCAAGSGIAKVGRIPDTEIEVTAVTFIDERTALGALVFTQRGQYLGAVGGATEGTIIRAWNTVKGIAGALSGFIPLSDLERQRNAERASPQ